MQGEIEILKLLNANGFEWAPKRIGFDLSYDEEVGFLLIILSWVLGDPLEWNDDVPLHRCARDKILPQVVELVLRLIQCINVNSRNSVRFDTIQAPLRDSRGVYA